MSKCIKHIALALSFVCAFVCLAVLAACGHNEENSGGQGDDRVTYTVTVAKPDDLPLDGIKAQWLKGDEAASDERVFGDDQKASVQLAADNYTVTLKGVPDGYVFEEASVTAENRDAAIIISGQNEPEQPETIVRVTVTLPKGITADLTQVSAQLFKGDEAAGEGRALNAKGIAQVPVIRDNQTYSVRLINLPDYLEYTAPTVEAKTVTAMATIDTAPAEIEYKVTVDTDENLEGATVTFYNGASKVAGAADLPVENKSVSKTLVAGDYVARLTSPDKSMLPGDASLTYTAAGREASITISINKYEINLDRPVNITTGYTDFKVTLTASANGEATEYYANADADGKALIRAPRGNYGIKVEDGTGKQLGHLPVTLTQSILSANVELAEKITSFDLTGEGRFFVTVNRGITNYTLTETGERSLYTVKWSLGTTTNTITISNYGASIDRRLTDCLLFILPEANTDKASFALNYQSYVDGAASSGYTYILSVTKSEAPEETAIALSASATPTISPAVNILQNSRAVVCEACVTESALKFKFRYDLIP